MKISLGSWAFTFGPYADRPISFLQVARRLSEAGYNGIDVSGFPPHVTLESFADSPSRRELVRRLLDLNLAISGYAADFSNINPVVPGNHRRYLEKVRRYVELCSEIGSPNLRVDTGAAPGSLSDTDYGPAMNRLADAWVDAATLAHAAGVRIVWEFEPGFAFNKPSEILALLNKVNHPNFRLLFDTAHAHMCAVEGARHRPPRETLAGAVDELFQLCCDRIGHLHLIDSDGTLYGEETSRHVPFGTGRVDFAKLAPKLAALPQVEWACVDLSFLPNAWELVESSLAFTRGLFSAAPADRTIAPRRSKSPA